MPTDCLLRLVISRVRDGETADDGTEAVSRAFWTRSDSGAGGGIIVLAGVAEVVATAYFRHWKR